MTAVQLTRHALDNGLDQMRNGWTANEIICCLMDAALLIEDARLWCDHCSAVGSRSFWSAQLSPAPRASHS